MQYSLAEILLFCKSNFSLEVQSKFTMGEKSWPTFEVPVFFVLKIYWPISFSRSKRYLLINISSTFISCHLRIVVGHCCVSVMIKLMFSYGIFNQFFTTIFFVLFTFCFTVNVFIPK